MDELEGMLMDFGVMESEEDRLKALAEADAAQAELEAQLEKV